MEAHSANGDETRVLLATGNPVREQRLLDVVRAEGLSIAGRCLDADGLVERANRQECDLALVCSDLHRLSPATLMAVRAAGIPIVLLVGADELPRYQGLAHLVPEGAAVEEVVAAVRDGLTKGSAYETRPLAEPEQPDDFFDANGSSGDGTGQVIVLCSGKGAPGVTTLALGLASSFAQAGSRAALVDCDLRGGNVAAYLDLDPRAGLVGLLSQDEPAPAPNRLSEELQDGPGFAVLAGIERAELQKRLSPARFTASLTALRQRFQYVLIDAGEVTGSDPSAIRSLTVRAASTVLLVTRPDLIALWNARLALQQLRDGFGVPAEKVGLIVNNRDGRDQYGAEEVERSLGYPVVADFKTDGKAGHLAIREQRPITAFSGSISKGLRRLAAGLATGDVQPVPKPANSGQRRPWNVLALVRRSS